MKQAGEGDVQALEIRLPLARLTAKGVQNCSEKGGVYA